MWVAIDSEIIRWVRCEICNDAGYWVSKEGAEIPCDFCPKEK